MKKHWNSISWKEKKTNNELYESKLLKLDSSKARKNLNWKPILNFDETIKMTSIWYKNFFEKKNIKVFDLSKKQIEYYNRKLKIK